MIKALLFDFDGTIANTNNLIIKSFKHAFKEYFNRDVDDEYVKPFYGIPLSESLLCCGREHLDGLTKAYRNYNLENHDALIYEFDGVLEGLKILKSGGMKLAIVTSKSPITLKKGMDILHFNGIFDAVVTPESTEKHKPDGEPAQKACQMLGVLPSEAIMVGDSIYDLQCGRNAKTKTAVVSYTITDKKLIDAENPDYCIENLANWAKEFLQNN